MRFPLFLLLALPLAVPAQVPEPTLRTTTSEVLLDLVVRDKHGQIIHNLRPNEVQVFEDGVPQKVRHFDFVDGHKEAPPSAGSPSSASTGAPSSAEPASAAGQTVNELRDISVISVVIANLDPRGRKLTLDAMREFVKTELRPKTYIGVFSLDTGGLRVVQPYTSDGEKIAAAVERAVKLALNVQLASIGQQNMPNTSHGAADTANGPTTDPNGGPATDPNGNLFGPVAVPNGPIGQTSASAAGPAAEINKMVESNWLGETQDVYMESQRYLTPLRTLVQSQAEIPGRKVLLLFSAGLPVHEDTAELLKTVISTANRSNVSIYALDTRGTTTASTLDYSRNLLQRAARKSMDQQLSPDKTVTPGEVILGEMAEQSIYSDTRANLAELAEDTGGQLLPDTLDLTRPLQQAVEDVRTHYELTYSPTNPATDGAFRKIEVKVSRPGAKVFSRSGYYALPVIDGRQIYPFEMLTLKALNTRPALHQFSFHADTLQFRPGPARTQIEFAFEAPFRELQVTKEGRWAKIHLDITALIKNEQGQVVDKISKDFPYKVPEDKLSQFQSGVISFTTPFLLPPGRYTIETAVVDRESMKASVSRMPLDVVEGSGLSMSDVTVARRIDSVQDAANALDPLEGRGGRVTPELSGVVSPDAAGKVNFYAIAYPPAPIDAPVDATLEIWRGGRLVMKSPGSEVRPDAAGAASMLASVETGKLPAGRYEVYVSFQYKGQTVTKATSFMLPPAS